LKILLLDIESSPHISYTWGTWQQNVAPVQLKEHGRTICWAAKWYEESGVHYEDERNGRKRMIRRMHKLMTDADIVVTYNGLKFDIPMLNNEFVKYDLDPIPPQKHIDLYRVARGRFKLASNKLEFVAKFLKVGNKIKNEGFELWIKVLAGEEKAWRDMMEYNIGDVKLLERVYTKLRPWVKNHPDVGVANSAVHCASCGSARVQRRGSRRTKYFSITRLHCQHCGAWSDGEKKKVKNARSWMD
jgi:DNA polymerase elongation subunit (family B)